MSTFQFPSVVSRTLDPTGKALTVIVAMHDREITDADLNLMQQLQTYKLQKFIRGQGATSGCTTYEPMQFNESNPNTFFIPAFDVLFNGEIVNISGQQSPDLTLNRVQVPAPVGLVSGEEDARLFIVFLELWYQSLNPISGAGYYQDPLNPGPKYFYPYGGILPDPSNAKSLPDDSVDPFQGLFTTERAQIQWRLNVQRVALDYDFTQETFGLYYSNARVPSASYITDGTGDPGQIVYGQASLPSTIQGISPLVGESAYVFINMGSMNGDTGLYRCGDGNVNNSLGTMDGYSYALPVAVVFQRNTGNFDVSTNIFGCASSSSSTSNTGTLATRISGRYDSKLADQIFPADVVDTRTTVFLDGIDMDEQMRKGFGDLVTGHTQLAVSRFSDPQGNKTEAVGSLLDYYVAVGPVAVANANTIGTFDGFANGFSSDQRTFYSSFQITTAQKATGTAGKPWVLGDSFAISLPQTSKATITSVNVNVLVSNPAAGTKTPAALLQGQIQINGLNSLTATVTFIKNLTGTAFDPGSNNIYVTVGVTYPASTGLNLQKIPAAVAGGVLLDTASGQTLPVYGVSEYEVQSEQLALQAYKIFTTNPEYSDLVLGTKIWIQVAGSSGTVQTVNGISQTTFVINCANLNESLSGLYATQAWDFATGTPYNITSRLMSSLPNNGGIQHIITLSGAVASTSTVVFSILAQNTAQLAYNAPVKGVTEVSETVLFGNYTGDSNFPVDSRVVIESISYDSTSDANTIVFGANGCQIKGISGDDTAVRYIWINSNGTLTAYSISSFVLNNGTLTVTVAGNGGNIVLAGSSAQLFMIVGSILPAFTATSTLTVQVQYLPYQGEGVINRDYEILHSEDNALLTTNGTGAAPVIGLSDVYPYDRELPIITMLPAQASWSDSTLQNTALATFFDSNYVAMRQNNVEHTFNAPLHTNDFIPPINKDTRKTIRFTATGLRGFSQATPHIGFAIALPTPRTVLGQNLQSTQAPITLYVNNVNGSDLNTGLSLETPKISISSALSELPPVLRHPCTIILVNTGVAYSLSAIQSTLETVALGDGDIRSAKQYCLGNLSRVIQDEGRLVISQQAGATNPVVIDATGFAGFGDGPTAAFYLDTSRVIINGVQFQGFTNPAVVAYNSDVDFVNCSWVGNVQAGSYVGCDSVILDGGSTSMPDSGTGHVLVQSNLTSSAHDLTIPNGVTPQSAFYVATRNSTIYLQQHSASSLVEKNIGTIPAAIVATAELNSSIDTDSTFQTSGQAVLSANSVLLRTVTVNPFLGGVVADSSSSTVTQVG